MSRPDFVNDLVEEIEEFFAEHGIRHERDGQPSPVDVVARYLYSLDKMIDPRPRRTHFSAELHSTLGSLDGRYRTAIEAIRRRFEAGGDLSGFLSRRAADAGFNDGLLSDFGVHHFHLGDSPAPGERHVRRTGDLLFVFVQPFDAFFLDVREHPNDGDPSDYGWSDVDLLNIVDSNWPDALKPYVVNGVEASTVTDEQRRVLRRKNANVVTQVGDKVIAPPGGGLMAVGSNLRCKFLARRLLDEVRNVEQLLEDHWDDWKAELLRAGLEVADSKELRLVRVAGTNLTPSQIGSLKGDLSRIGWGIAHTASGTLIDSSFDSQ